MFKKTSSLKTVSLAAAMTAALMLGSAVHAQTNPTGKPSDSSGSVSTGATAKTPEQRDAAKADKQAAKSDKKQAKAAKRAARKSKATTDGAAPTDSGGTTK
ncbi:MAG: hypothetical protein ABI893_03575 [Polaromonas sp.]|uniref:hypothetical protein n=1 Tax=Polaromonas sp. TaxID=1869339 RepID=UPI0032668B83